MENTNDLLQEAAKEIKRLRDANAMQASRLQMFDDMMLLFRTEPPRFGCCNNSNDILFKLNNKIKEEELKKQKI